jgi:hypothetical protein
MPFDPDQPFTALNPDQSQQILQKYGAPQQAASQQAAQDVQPPSLIDWELNGGLDSADSTLKGLAYLRQFPLEVQAAVQNYLNGDTMPTGNPRQQQISYAAKLIAQKYAADIGKPDLANDALFPARRAMMEGLTKAASPSSIGGQITFGGTALSHLANVAETATDLNNVNAGLAPVGRVINTLKNMGTDNSEIVSKMEGEIQHYGQEVTKFYSGSGGSNDERSRFLETMSPNATSAQLAGAIRAERDQLPGRFEQLHQEIAQTLGQEAADKALSRMNIPALMGRLNTALAKLDPGGPEAHGRMSGPSGIQEGSMATNPQTGQRIIMRGGAWQPIQ